MMRARSDRRWMAVVAVAVLGLTTMLFVLGGQSSGAADCDIARYTVNGQPDVASYLQCEAPSVTPSTVEPGGEVTITAGGYASNSPVVIELHSDPVVLDTFQSNGFGNIAGSVRIPVDTSLGAHEIWAIGVDVAGNELINVLPIQVALAVSGSGSTSTSTSSTLPATGSDVGGYVGVGLALIALGGAVVWGVRRQRPTEA